MIISMAIHKGGSGKTTSTVNLGAGLARKGNKVLLIDFDPQSNLSLSLGITSPEKTIYGALMGDYKLPRVNIAPGLDLAPSTLEFAEAEFSLIVKPRREDFLKKTLAGVKHEYDFILVDCPPSIGILTINSLVASDGVLIPVQSSFLAASGFQKMIDFISYIKQEINPGIDLLGVFLTQHDPHKILNRNAYDGISHASDGKIFKTYIRNNVRLAEAPGYGQTIFDYDPECNGAADYSQLTNEFLSKTVRA